MMHYKTNKTKHYME